MAVILSEPHCVNSIIVCLQMQGLIILMLKTECFSFGVNTMPVEALAHKVAECPQARYCQCWIAHVIIIIKSEVSTFPIVIIFFRGCVPEMFVTSYSVTYCIYVP